MKVLHVITGLNTGGAEMMLCKLLSALRAEPGVRSEVISLGPPGPMAAKIAALGVPVASAGMKDGLGALARVARLRAMIRAAAPDVVQTWMAHANLLGGLAARAAGPAPVVWNLRQSQLDPASAKPATERVIRLAGRLSRAIPARIVCVSESARRAHAAVGYDAARMTVIPNGFDAGEFRPDPAARAGVRAELGLAPGTPLVGLVARVDPYKDHATFLAAAAGVAEAVPGAAFVLAGAGAEAGNPALDGPIRDHGLAGRVHLLGRRDDVARITAALDVAVSSSASGEGFSNTLGEALCAGVPVAATDVGDAAAIVGAEGRIVPPRDAPALARAIVELLSLTAEARAALGAAGRARMARDHALPAIAARYLALYRELA